MNFIFEPCPSVKAIVARVSFAMIKFCMRNLQNLAAIDSLLYLAPLRLTLRMGMVVEIRDGERSSKKIFMPLTTEGENPACSWKDDEILTKFTFQEGRTDA